MGFEHSTFWKEDLPKLVLWNTPKQLVNVSYIVFSWYKQYISKLVNHYLPSNTSDLRASELIGSQIRSYKDYKG